MAIFIELYALIYPSQKLFLLFIFLLLQFDNDMVWWGEWEQEKQDGSPPIY